MCPRRPQVRATGGCSACPDSSSKQIHAPVAAASLVPSPRSGCARPRWRPRPARRPGAPGPGGEPHPVQQVGHAPQRVGHAEQAGGQRRDPGQRPPLVLVPAEGGRAGIQRRTEPGELVLVQLAGAPAGPLRRQRRLAAGPPGAPPLVHRLRAHPQGPGDLPGVRVLLEHLRGLKPHLLPAGPAPRGQPATIRIPHDTGLNPPPPPVTQARRP